MYESKYSKYLIQNTNRFATKEEIISFCKPNKKYSKIRYAGVPIFYDGNSLYVDNSDAHFMGEGQTGSKKSRTSVILTIQAILSAGEHAVIIDPKGELYRKTGGQAQDLGYNVKAFNIRNPKRSDCWNPMCLPYMLSIRGKNEESEEMLNDYIESLTAPIKANTKDDYWPVRVNSYLYALATLLMDSVTADVFNVSTLMKIAGKKNRYALEELIKDCDEKQPFINSLESFLNMSAEKTQDCLYDTVEQAFGPYSKKTALLNILSENEIDFADLVSTDKKTVIYIIYPDEKQTMSFIVNLFLTQCYFYLMLHIDENRLSRLEKRVNFVCEEFGNLPRIDGFSNRISEARGYNIRYFLYVQSYGQIENTYKEEAKTIKGNCDWIIYPSKELSFLKEVSDFCGNIKDYNGNTHPLLSVDRIQHLKKYQDGAEAVIIKSGQYPFIVKLPDYEYIDVFGKSNEVELEDRKKNYNEHTLTMKEWLQGINKEVFNFPFPKVKRSVDRRITKSKPVNESMSSRKSKNTKNKDDVISDEIMKELEAKFDELFGQVDGEDE